MKSSAKLILFLTMIVGLSFYSCAGDDDDGDSGSDTSNQSQQGSAGQPGSGGGGIFAIAANALAAAYPEGLTISSLPSEVDSTPGTAAQGTALRLTQDDPPPGEPPAGDMPPGSAPSPDGNQGGPSSDHPKTQLAEQQAKLGGEGECFLGLNLNSLFQTGGGQQDICFQFDVGMLAGVEQGTIDRGQFNPTVQASDGTTAGILSDLQAANGFAAADSEEACMIAKSREKVAERSASLSASLSLLQGMLCQAKKDGLADSTPAVGGTIDLTASLATFAEQANLAFTTATIERLADNGTRPVFRTTVALNSTNNANQSSSLTLTHSPSAGGNQNYNGVLQIVTPRTDDQTNELFNNLVSMIYQKSGDTVDTQRLRYEVRDASFNTERLDPSLFFATDGRIDLNAGADDSGSYGPGQANDYSEGMGYFAFDINPSTFAGSLSFWTNPGGSYQEGARGFVFSLSQNTDGTLAGCSWAGSVDYSIRQALREGLDLVPNGCSTPQIQSGGVCTGGQVWKQCFVQDSAGVYQIDTDEVLDDSAGFDVLPSAPTDMPNIDLSDIESVLISE